MEEVRGIENGDTLIEIDVGGGHNYCVMAIVWRGEGEGGRGEREKGEREENRKRLTWRKRGGMNNTK